LVLTTPDPLDITGSNALFGFFGADSYESLCDISGCVSRLIVAGTLDAVVAPVPEPISLSLFGAGLAGAVAMRPRKKKAA
jgi:hypothetical protein